MTNREELKARLAAVERRLAERAAEGLPAGLTDPEPGGSERWEAGQVWAHLAEFPRYWHGQVQAILRSQAGTAGGTAIPFGRLRSDPGRLGAIERDRHTDPGVLLDRLRSGIAAVREAIGSLSDQEWKARGLHPALGEMPVGAIFDRFVVSHLEEHAEQLDKLASSR